MYYWALSPNLFVAGFGANDARWSPGNYSSPDGGNNGVGLLETNNNGGSIPHWYYLFADIGSGQKTISSYFKANQRTWVYITSDVDGTTRRAFFDIQNGVGASNNYPSSSATISSAGNGWYRCSVTYTASSSSIWNGFGIATGDGVSSYTAQDPDGVYQFGQLAQSGTLTAYPFASTTTRTQSGLAFIAFPSKVTIPRLMRVPAAHRTMYVTKINSDMQPRFVQCVNDVLDYPVDFTSWLGTDTISSVTWTIDSGITSTSPTPSHTNTVATINLSGGTAGTTYNVNSGITTSGGKTFNWAFVVEVVKPASNAWSF